MTTPRPPLWSPISLLLVDRAGAGAGYRSMNAVRRAAVPAVGPIHPPGVSAGDGQSGAWGAPDHAQPFGGMETL